MDTNNKIKIIIPSIVEVIEINKIIGGNIMNKGTLEFLMAKVKSKNKDKEHKKRIAKISSILWMDIIQLHPFVDGNKRTATESVLLFLEKNNLMLETNIAGRVYVSLKIANNEMKYEELIKWVYQRLKVVKR